MENNKDLVDDRDSVYSDEKEEEEEQEQTTQVVQKRAYKGSF